jgi:methyl-accepting chemotaxis protein
VLKIEGVGATERLLEATRYWGERRFSLRNILLAQDKETLEKEVANTKEASDKLIAEIENVKKMVSSEKMKNATNDYYKSAQATNDVTYRIGKMFADGRKAEALNLLHSAETIRIVNEELKCAQEIIVINEENNKRLYAEMDSTKKTVLALTLITILLGAVFSLVFGYSLAKSISVALMAATAHMMELAKGDFSIAVPEKYKSRKDEIGDISNAIDRVNTSVGEMVAQVKDSADQLVNATEQISSSSQQIADSSSPPASRNFPVPCSPARQTRRSPMK